jgi:putative redox protein
MGHSISAENTGGMAFEVEQDGHSFWVDADDAVGGTNKGPRPKALLLSGLAGCTGMDVASILGKMKVEYRSLRIEVDANLTDEHPRVYDRIHLKYILSGDNLDVAKIEKAVTLSQDKYCGVSAMLRKAAEITYEIQTSQ